MSIWKKWIVLVTVSLLASLMPVAEVKAKEDTVYESYQTKSKQDSKKSSEQTKPTKNSVVPYAFKFIGSFLLILFLLFIVLKLLSNKSRLYPRGGPFHPIGGHSLGNQRSMQLLMVGDTLYILGVGENVNLIRTIPPGEEQRKLLEAAAEKPTDTVTKWGSQLKKTSQEKWDDHLLKQLKEVKSHFKQNKDPR